MIQRSFLLIAITLLLIDHGWAATICFSDQQLCGNTCYTPDTQECLCYTQSSALSPCENFKVCEKGQQLCGDVCFTPETQQCLCTAQASTTSPCESFNICGKSQLLCRDTCYTPGIEQCQTELE